MAKEVEIAIVCPMANVMLSDITKCFIGYHIILTALMSLLLESGGGTF